MPLACPWPEPGRAVTAHVTSVRGTYLVIWGSHHAGQGTWQTVTAAPFDRGGQTAQQPRGLPSCNWQADAHTLLPPRPPLPALPPCCTALPGTRAPRQAAEGAPGGHARAPAAHLPCKPAAPPRLPHTRQPPPPLPPYSSPPPDVLLPSCITPPHSSPQPPSLDHSRTPVPHTPRLTPLSRSARRRRAFRRACHARVRRSPVRSRNRGSQAPAGSRGGGRLGAPRCPGVRGR